MLASTLEFFKNLSQQEYDGIYYDFHNDYDCEEFTLDQGSLILNFRHVITSSRVVLMFSDVQINKVIMSDKSGITTVDNLYRGRYEDKGVLLDTLNDGRAYFYLEFDEGQQFEFWAAEITFSITT